jgi:DNA-binding transcriptional ArsR family regulator
MSSIVFEKPSIIKELLITNPEEAKALEDPLRVAIIDMLSHNPMSVQDIVDQLKNKKKIQKAATSIRHHIEILKDAGLIELVKMEEAKGGGVLKYYASNAKLLSFNTPKDFEIKFQSAIAETSDELMKLLADLAANHKNELKEMAEALKPCPYCNTRHFVEFLLLNVLRKATVEVIRKKEFSDLIKKICVKSGQHN